MRITFLGIGTVLFFFYLTSNLAHAYDVDTHFYSTYAMARHACIRKPLALKIATATQWMDESYISDPTSYILLVPDGVHKRRLLHFPASRAGTLISVDSQRQVMGFDKFISAHAQLVDFGVKLLARPEDREKMKTLLYWTETAEDDRFASQMLMEALKEGNTMKAAMSLHVIEDSYAHAGTPAEYGHTVFWHWPDRPFFKPDEYKKMTKSIFQALVAIRAQLPEEALDRSLHTFSNQANCDMDARQLSDAYFDQVKDVVSYNILHDKEYVTETLRWFINSAIANGYLVADPKKVDQLLAAVGIDGTFDSYTGLEKLIKILIKGQMSPEHGVLQWHTILDQMQLLRAGSPVTFDEFIAQFGTGPVGAFDINSESVDAFVKIVASNLLRFNVPSEIDPRKHLEEMENDKAVPRQIEMTIRERNMQNYIEKTFGEKIKFESNNTGDELGFGKEIRMEDAARPNPFPNDGYEHVTFSLKEKNAFDHIVFKYLYPTTKEGTLEKITAAVHAVNTSKHWVSEIWEGIVAAYGLHSIVPTVIHDLVNEHTGPSEDNFFYRNPYEFKDYQNRGIVKKLMGPGDVWLLENIFGSRAENSRG